LLPHLTSRLTNPALILAIPNFCSRRPGPDRSIKKVSTRSGAPCPCRRSTRGKGGWGLVLLYTYIHIPLSRACCVEILDKLPPHFASLGNRCHIWLSCGVLKRGWTLDFVAMIGGGRWGFQVCLPRVVLNLLTELGGCRKFPYPTNQAGPSYAGTDDRKRASAIVRPREESSSRIGRWHRTSQWP
jgi:hypothetical protein